ncbi:hypothetical protein X474_24600 [Dethiosulfatarculus sandiegensis]|uniref:Uncharacterized protein n=1 Tax=Dethiosulfatarculus sandiegensis TaxID=1429043 RepID=A0A0D2HLX2_9BACT|nr:hypothetical protein X474_24600 [Dethiosulfatarculus sandiegensis]
MITPEEKSWVGFSDTLLVSLGGFILPWACLISSARSPGLIKILWQAFNSGSNGRPFFRSLMPRLMNRSVHEPQCG